MTFNICLVFYIFYNYCDGYNINEFRIEYYGNPYLKGFEVEFQPKMQRLSVPRELDFNSAWRLTHECIKCENEVEFVDSGMKNEICAVTF